MYSDRVQLLELSLSRSLRLLKLKVDGIPSSPVVGLVSLSRIIIMIVNVGRVI
jgi:hypothetical protein